MSHHSSPFRAPSPAAGSQLRVQERTKLATASAIRSGSAGGMLKQPNSARLSSTPRDSRDDGSMLAAQANPAKPVAKAATPSGGQRKSPVSGLRKSPVPVNDSRNAGEPRKRGTHLIQGAPTSVRSVSGANIAGINMASGATPRNLDMAATPRGPPYTSPIVTVNPMFEVSLRHQGTSLNRGGPMTSQPEDQTVNHEGSSSGLSAAQGRRMFATKRSVSGSPILGNSDGSRRVGSVSASVDPVVGQHGALSSRSDSDQRSSLQSAIVLLQQNELLEKDLVLRDLLQICLNRVSTTGGQRKGDRVIFTSDSATQVATVETGTQTEVKSKEKKMKTKGTGSKRIRERHNCSLSDSDVPSDNTESRGHVRRTSLDESISLSTNSPRESVDGYSRDLSDASGPVSVSSLVQMSVASSTDASQTTTLANEQARDIEAQIAAATDSIAELGLHKAREASRAGNRGDSGIVPPAHSDQIGGAYCEQALPAHSQALSIAVDEDYAQELSQQAGHWAGSPSPSIETLMELQRILDEQYKKLVQAGSLAGPPGNVLRPNPTRFDGINSPATAEMRRLTMESALASGTVAEDVLHGITPPDHRPPNPDPTKRSPGSSQLSPGAIHPWRVPPPDSLGAFPETHLPQSVRMGNSPPKEVQKPVKQLHSIPTLNIPVSRPRHDAASVESPLSTPRSGSAFLAHINSARSSTNSGSATSTPRTVPIQVIKH